MFKINNFSIRNKIVLSIVLIFFVSVGIGITMYNNLMSYEKTLNSNLFFNHYYVSLSQIQNNYNYLQITILNISNVKSREEIIKYSNDFRNIDIQITKQFDNLRSVSLENYDSKQVNQIVELNDTLNAIELTYKQVIFTTYSKLEDQIQLVNQPQNIFQNYKTLLQEQINAGTLTSIDIKNKTKDTLINELVYIYKNTISDLKNYLLKQLNIENQKIERIKNTYVSKQFNKEEFEKTSSKNQKIFIYLFIIFVSISVIVLIFITYTIVRPLLNINENLNKLSNGEMIENINTERRDEIGLIENSLNYLINYLKENSQFAKSLAQGDFEANLKAQHVEDILRNSLLTLRDSLISAKKEEQKRAIEDYRRQRTAEAISKFADILRTFQNDLNTLSKELISNLVKFLNANQGMLFTLNDDGDSKYLKLLSTYAWDREKFIEKRIEVGEGLIGSVVIDKFSVYMTDVPEDYIEIKSGTGSANPKSLLITPLKVEDEVLGILELASFNEFESYEIKLVESISENIASTLKSVKISAKTSELLENFQIQAFEMKEQEETLKNKINDLRKIENDFKLKEEDYIQKIKQLEDIQKQLNFKFIQVKKQLDDLSIDYSSVLEKTETLKNNFYNSLNNTDDGIIIINENNIVEYINKAFIDITGYSELELIGSNIKQYIISKEEVTFNTFLNYSQDTESKMLEMVKINKKDSKQIDISVFFTIISENEKQKVMLSIRDKSKYIIKQDTEDDFIDKILKVSFEKSIKSDYFEKYILENNLSIPEVEINKNEIISWSSYLELGISLIDKQHQKWIQFINELYSAILNNSKEEILLDIFKRLFEYTDYHFGFEEKYMKEFSFPFFDNHHLNHEKFINEVNKLFNQYITSSKKEYPYRLLFYLKEWVLSHIIQTDKKYVDLFKSHGLK